MAAMLPFMLPLVPSPSLSAECHWLHNRKHLMHILFTAKSNAIAHSLYWDCGRMPLIPARFQARVVHADHHCLLHRQFSRRSVPLRARAAPIYGCFAAVCRCDAPVYGCTAAVLGRFLSFMTAMLLFMAATLP
eukprot:2035555-Rhodomonas_salina.1